MHPSADSARAQILNQRNSVFWYFTPTLFWYFQAFSFPEVCHLSIWTWKREGWSQKELTLKNLLMSFDFSRAHLYFVPILRHIEATFYLFLEGGSCSNCQIAKLLPNLVLSCHNVVPFQRFSQNFCLKSIVGDFPSTEYWKWITKRELQMTLPKKIFSDNGTMTGFWSK